MNFFQKGLAGLESRLDRVLLDETEAAALAREREQQLVEPQEGPFSAVVATPRAFSESQMRSGESDKGIQKMTMQERLAKVLEGKRSASPVSAERGRPDSQQDRTGMGTGSVKSVTSVLITANDGVLGASDESQQYERKPETIIYNRKNIDGEGESGKEDDAWKEELQEDMSAETEDTAAPPGANDLLRVINTSDIIGPSVSPQEAKPHGPREAPPTPINGRKDRIIKMPRDELERIISRLQEDLVICETRRQEETYAASERIDALEEKIRYLARESADASRHRGNLIPAGGLEKKLAEREEKIALLLEEGENLSKNELRLQNTIKKLRAKAQDDERIAADTKRKAEKAEKDITAAKEEARRAHEAEKMAQQRVKILNKVESEVEILRRERDASKGIMAELKEKTEAMRRRAEEAENKVQTEALENEQKTTVVLRAHIEHLQSEAALVENRFRAEINNLRNKMERQAEQSRLREAELTAEQAATEGKMESLRARAEEVSSGATGDAHAKLLRQVEMLQTQYAIASENWQGIEASLLSRVTNIEKERDELAKKEVEARRKARDMNLKLKQLEVDLENATMAIRARENEISSQTTEGTALRVRLFQLEANLESVQSGLVAERSNWQRELQARLDEERMKWELETSCPASPSPPSTGTPSVRKPSVAPSTTESFFLGHTRRQPSRPVSTEPIEALQARKSSHNYTGGFTPPIRTSSATSLPAAAGDDIDFFEGFTPLSPQRYPDVLSVSTVAAGPSVQLVERMSAAVRRLESEMAGSREEIARITIQRDEARSEIIDLMREVEKNRGAEDRVRQLEMEMRDMEVKQLTTLEMLGEKSEKVTELEADVVDLKQMYRELVSQAIK